MTHEVRIALLHEAAKKAATITLKNFRCAHHINNKASEKITTFDPVTQSDKEAEQTIRNLILKHFPQDSLIGEEQKIKKGTSDYHWVIDPIDGTRSFIAGLPSWGILIGLSYKEQMIAGLMAQPFTGETFFCNETHAFYTRDNKIQKSPERITTSTKEKLSHAIIMTTDPQLFNENELTTYQKIEKSCQFYRYGYDCYAYAMLAKGHIECVMEAGLNLYDIAPLIPIIEKAGGLICDWNGHSLKLDLYKSPHKKLNILACANSNIQQEILEIIKA